MASAPKPAVRQVRGPGMNLGLKKPRYDTIKKPQPTKSTLKVDSTGARSSSNERKDYSKTGSYLSGTFWK